MRRVSAMVLSAVLAVGGACSKGEDGEAKQAGKSAAAASGDEKTETGVAGQQLLERVDRCWGSYEAWDKEAYRDCFSEEPTVTYVDNVPPQEVTSRNDAIVQAGAFRNAFPDFKAERVAILVNGKRSALVARVTGTHRNASMGMPPTGKPVSTLHAEVAQYDDEGRIQRVRAYMDHSTLLHQLGILESASAAGAEKPWPAPVRAVARGDEGERRNLEVVKAGLGALAKAEVPGAVAMYAEDGVFRYLPEGQPYVGREEIEGRIRSYAELGLDMSQRDAWAAGDWVVVEMTTKGTLADGFAGVAETKGKSWELNSLELFRLADGKVKEHWTFANGLKFAADVGLFDPSLLGGGE